MNKENDKSVNHITPTTHDKSMRPMPSDKPSTTSTSSPQPNKGNQPQNTSWSNNSKIDNKK